VNPRPTPLCPTRPKAPRQKSINSPSSAFLVLKQNYHIVFDLWRRERWPVLNTEARSCVYGWNLLAVRIIEEINKWIKKGGDYSGLVIAMNRGVIAKTRTINHREYTK